MAEKRALLFGLGAVACWSTVATAFKVALRHLDPYQLLLLSTLTAAGFLLLLCLVTHGARALSSSLISHWRITLITTALNPVVYYLVLFAAYDRLPAQVAMSINYTWAITLTVMAALFLRQKMIREDFMAAGICYFGVLVLATQGNPDQFFSIDRVGLGLALLSTLIWATYWIFNMRDPRAPLIGITLNFTLAVPLTAVVCWMMTDFSFTVTGLLAAGYVGLVEMAAGFVLWSLALRSTANAARVGNLIFLSPVVSLMLISTVLKESILPATMIGLTLIIGGLVLQQWGHNRAVKLQMLE